MKIERPRGTRDFTGEEMRIRGYVESAIANVFESYNYKKINTPVFEHVELFDVKSGEEIRDHMYVFKDKSGRDICLRPEGTAPVCRMFVSELRTRRKPLKLYYSGPMFRYERPQKGRYREFWHMGVELIGSERTYADVEVIQMACECLDKLNLKYELEIGHTGILRGLLNKLDVSGDEQDNIMLLVDKGNMDKVKSICDDKRLRDIVRLDGAGALTGVRKIVKQLYADEPEGSSDDEIKFTEVKGPSPGYALEELEQIHVELVRSKKEHEINLGIARGLSYYTGLVFEIRVEGLGAQDQICGGGRYDTLIETFGGPKTPAVGFAFGFDRVVEALEHQGIEVPEEKQTIVIAPVSENERNDALKIGSMLREQGLVVETDLLDRKLGSLLEYASETGVKYTVIVGQKELKEKKVAVRDMESGKQSLVGIEKLGEFFIQ